MSKQRSWISISRDTCRAAGFLWNTLCFLWSLITTSASSVHACCSSSVIKLQLPQCLHKDEQSVRLPVDKGWIGSWLTFQRNYLSCTLFHSMALAFFLGPLTILSRALLFVSPLNTYGFSVFGSVSVKQAKVTESDSWRLQFDQRSESQASGGKSFHRLVQQWMNFSGQERCTRTENRLVRLARLYVTGDHF